MLLYQTKEADRHVKDGSREEETIEGIQEASAPRNHGPGVFEADASLQGRFEEVPGDYGKSYQDSKDEEFYGGSVHRARKEQGT